MERRGFGAARGAVQKPCIPGYCVSPQLAPPVLSPVQKQQFAKTQDYHTKK